jgi:hypothetical protein
VNAAERSHWLEPSPPIAVDGTGRAAPAHKVRVRDLHTRFGNHATYCARCTCGWISGAHTGRLADRAARLEGLAHVEGELPRYGHRAGAAG